MFSASVAAIFLLSFGGCDNRLFDERVSEGVIEYKVSYPYMPPENMMADFLPGSMTLRFKNDVYISELSAGMGMFRTCFISNANDYSMLHLVKLINKKYASRLDKDNSPVLYEGYPPFTVIELNEMVEVAGYTCKKALVIFHEIHKKSFYLYYTTGIRLKDANWGNPFHEIDGVLLQYEIEKYDMVMRFSATGIKETTVQDSEFDMPPEYKDVPYSQMDKELSEIFKSFSY